MMKKTIETFNNALNEAQFLDWRIIKIDQISNHPDDQYLCKVLVERLNHEAYEPIVTYIFNSSTGSFNHGHYFSNLQDAQKDFEERN